MSFSSLSAKDSFKTKTPTICSDSPFDENKNTNPGSNEDNHEINKIEACYGESEDSNQTLDLFKQYRPLVKPDFANGQRRASLLELSLLPRLSCNHIPPSLQIDKGVDAQLTIFYCGQVNVYNDVPFEKAQAIMLLAGESSLSAPVLTKLPKEDEKKTLHNNQNLPSLCNSQADLPIARKLSLKRFLEKRRDRITRKAPYSSPETRHDEMAANEENEINMKLQNSPLVLTPFPSRFGNSMTLPN